MHAFLTTSYQLPAVSLTDILVIEPELSIGIDQVRQVQHFLSRKPIQSDRNIVVIRQAHLLTLPAQHALLKTLEEPPGNSQIYLVTDYPDQLLPTVLSRVQLIDSPTNPRQTDAKQLDKTQKLLGKLLAAPVGERLKLMEAQAFTRDTALLFLDQLEQLIHQDLSLAKLYPKMVATRKFLKANCNVKLTLDNLCLVL